MNTLLKPFNTPRIAGVVGSTIQDSFIPKSLYVLASTIDRTIIHPTQMVGRNSAYWKNLFYLTGRFNENINQKNVLQMLQEEEIGFGQRLSNYGKIVFKNNAPCIHLGGERGDCRMGLKSKSLCDKYGIGIERFG